MPESDAGGRIARAAHLPYMQTRALQVPGPRTSERRPGRGCGMSYLTLCQLIWEMWLLSWQPGKTDEKETK